MGNFKIWLWSNAAWARCLRTVFQGIIGVIVANLDLILGGFAFAPSAKPVVAALVMAVLSPVMAALGGEGDTTTDTDATGVIDSAAVAAASVGGCGVDGAIDSGCADSATAGGYGFDDVEDSAGADSVTAGESEGSFDVESAKGDTNE